MTSYALQFDAQVGPASSIPNNTTIYTQLGDAVVEAGPYGTITFTEALPAQGGTTVPAVDIAFNELTVRWFCGAGDPLVDLTFNADGSFTLSSPALLINGSLTPSLDLTSANGAAGVSPKADAAYCWQLLGVENGWGEALTVRCALPPGWQKEGENLPANCTDLTLEMGALGTVYASGVQGGVSIQWEENAPTVISLPAGPAGIIILADIDGFFYFYPMVWNGNQWVLQTNAIVSGSFTGNQAVKVGAAKSPPVPVLPVGPPRSQ